ncbi:MAG: serine hydrolase, partial [Gammaproteobacteria bacterium]|nr:serine hydrolase [Gammaproteobacteria bacterium]
GDSPPVAVYGGVNGIGSKIAINQNSLFQIGSITKSFITVVILQLAQEKHFSLDDPTLIAKYFPEYPKWGGITLRQLLNMTSGIPGNGTSKPTDIYMKFTLKEYASYISPTEILNLTYAYPLDFKPGTSWEYSNTNYTLLGQFIQRVTGQSPEAEVNARIIQKLSLKHTYFPVNTLQEIPGIPPDEIVHGYAFSTKSYDPYAFMPFGQDVTDFSLSEYNSAGAMVSTPSDLNTYLHALYNPGPLLNQAQISQLTTLVSRVNGTPFNPNKNLGNPLGFGFGIVGYYWPEEHRMVYLYNGVTTGFTAYYVYDPKTQQYFNYAVNSLADKDDAVVFKKVMALFGDLVQCH